MLIPSTCEVTAENAIMPLDIGINPVLKNSEISDDLKFHCLHTEPVLFSEKTDVPPPTTTTFAHI